MTRRSATRKIGDTAPVSDTDDAATVGLGPRPPSRARDANVDELTNAPEPVLAETEIASPPGNANSPSGPLAARAAVSGARTPSPIETMRLEEIERSRYFIRVALVITIAGIVTAATSPGDSIARAVVLTASVASAVGQLRALQVLANPATYDARMLLVPVLLIAIGAMSGLYYWGTVSPVTGMLVYGIYFFSLSADRFTTTFTYLFVAIVHLVLAVGIMAGVFEDRGIVNMSELTFLNQLALIGICEFLYFIAFLTARISQRVTLRAVQRLELAIRQVAQRDAMLAEAAAQLDRALKIGGPGRFTEHVIGSYKVGNLLGRGGMGEVYEARHVVTNEQAAMKTMHAGALADPTLVARFMREATIASRISCPHVVRVLELGQTTGEIPYIAMERLHGHDLADELRRRRRLELRAARVLASELAIGLEAAHATGIVHRDLKPSNVFRDEKGTPRWMILDFGVSKVGGTGTLTQGAIVGTPAYMAPEQASGENVDARADVYALAAILYRAVTGHPPFASKDVAAMLFDVCFRMPTRPSLLTDLPTDVDRVLALGLAKRVADRIQTATELASWFADAVEGRFTAAQRRRADDQIERAAWGQGAS